MLSLTEEDQQLIKEKGSNPEYIQQQLEIFRKGVPFAQLDRPCTIGDGITQLTSTDLEHYAQTFQEAKASCRITKFVPASGAATRMFKTLMGFLEQTSTQPPDILVKDVISKSTDSKLLEQFFQHLESFPFYKDLELELKSKGITTNKNTWIQHAQTVLELLLFSPGLNYAQLPKGLLKFHRYSDHSRTPLEEQIMEGIAYARDFSDTVRIHFTISPEHEQRIHEHLAQIRKRLEDQDIQLDITFSYQRSSTDTIAVDLNNCPFRDSQGKLIFRAGGHGALLPNLNDLKGDIVFIKNIDNVVPERLADQVNLYKEALGGFLVTIQDQIFTYLRQLSQSEIHTELFREAFDFAKKTLGVTIPSHIHNQSLDKQQRFLIDRLNRPLRVCGMVVNAGEPGGGPFWVTHQDGSYSLQIVESSQVDPESPAQQAILKTSTHFNPVDLVCGVKDFQGKSFDLLDFSDPNTSFISLKSYHGKEIKALELPGLWNGAMAHWNTLFVEVPAFTFNPVKTVFDLLRPEHQPIAPCEGKPTSA